MAAAIRSRPAGDSGASRSPPTRGARTSAASARRSGAAAGRRNPSTTRTPGIGSVASAAGSSRSSWPSTSPSGRSAATGGSAAPARSERTVQDAGRRAANSRSSRDFPVPASPLTTTHRAPSAAAPAAAASARSSSSRSTSTGQLTERDATPVSLGCMSATRDPELRARLAGLTLRDEERLARRGRRGDDLEAEIVKAEERIARRRAAVPRITYPNLPVSERKDELLAAIRDNQVVVVAGETGSGKTTQLPKIALELGRGIRGGIAHTQPRRLAARTVAERIAEELSVPLGEAVGYAVRFNDRSSQDTLVRLMTDGLLLSEIQRGPLLRRYGTIIVDEAHERSLNVDFLLGYLHRILPRRPDLKVVITSATIDPERFSAHFGDAPIVEVSGRTYPVEVRYRPVVDPDDPASDPDRDPIDAIGDAVDELLREGPGDVLVFLSGEREIRDTADAL